MTQPAISAERVEEMLAHYTLALGGEDVVSALTELSALRAQAQGSEAVAWRVKDYADGWVLCSTEASAKFQADNGNLVQPLFASPQQVVTDEMVERFHRSMMSELFLRCQPNNGDVFGFMDDRKDVVRIALTAALSEIEALRLATPPVQAQPQGVVVKALEWVRPDGARSGETMRRVETVVGTYRVWTHHEANGAWFWQVGDGPARANGSGTEQECFADAQADYERRVLSALTSPPAPVDGENDRG